VYRFPLAVTFIVLCVLEFSRSVMAQAAAPGGDQFPKLPSGPGRDIELRVCSQCHSPELPSTKHMSLDDWNQLIGQMQVNGAEASDDEFDQIATYLAKSFPPQ
jgi:mono/diheme cytochrome c family protein